MGKEKEIVYEKFMELQQQVHVKNQKKIKESKYFTSISVFDY